MTSPTAATDRAFLLSEGPVWDDRRQRLLWVDILAGEVLIGQLAGDRVEVEESLAFPSLVGAVALSTDDRLLVAARDRLVLVEADGSRRDSPALFDGTARRFNDGQADPAGRFVIGTLSLAGPSSTEELFRVDERGVDLVDDDLTLSNGLAWSIDSTLFYNVDTMRRTIRVRDYDPLTGAHGKSRPLAQLDHGDPDGICVDVEDHLWVAVWGEGEVLRLSPDGEVVDRIGVPAPHTSSVAFAGPDLDVLVITTASDGLTAEQQARFPASGCLFTARPGVHGIPARRVAASVLDHWFPPATPEPR